jgi:HNH endonuclease/NUMOD4 motif
VEWRSIPSFPDYEVSEFGEVRRARKSWRGTEVGRIMKPYRRPDGYNMYILREGGRSWHPRAHQLVAEAFLGPRPFEGVEVCHNDGSRDNDHYSNLRWDTRSANHLDRRAHGTAPWGERAPQAKLIAADVANIRERCASGELQRAVAVDFDVAQGQVSRIVRGAHWAHTMEPNGCAHPARRRYCLPARTRSRFGLKGVTLRRDGGWEAGIGVDGGRRAYLGRFDSLGGAALAYGHAAAVLQGPFCPPEVLALIAADAARRDYELFQGELTLAIEYGLAAAAPAPPPGWREISPGSPIMLISAGRAEESHLNAAPVS